MKKDDHNDLERIERLERLLADLADEVSTGSTGHIRTAAQNKALGVLRELRPTPDASPTSIPVGELCPKMQDRDDPDSHVCLLRDGHKGGHQFGPKPAA